MKDFRQLPYRCVFEILIVLGHMARIIDVAGGSYNDTIKELTNDTYSTNDDSISPTNNQISSENEVLAGHKTVLYKQFYPCPEMCKCDRRQNKYSDGKLLYTADCSRAGLKQVPQRTWNRKTEVLLLDRNKLGQKQLLKLPALCNVKMIDLSHNHFYQLESWDTNCLGQLEILLLSFNTIQYLPSKCLVNFPNLQTLVFRRNAIEIIDMNALHGLNRLVSLELSGNWIYSVDPGWFHDLKVLQNLHMAKNDIHFIQNKAFIFLRKLLILDLRENKISRLYPLAFFGLAGLEQLFLQDNHLKEISAQYLSVFHDINLIDLSRNHFKYFPTGMFSNINVTHLKLNHLKSLHIIDKHSFQNLSHLEAIEINWNSNLAYIDRAAFYNVPKVTNLSLAYNSLSGLDSELLEGLPSLRSLSLSGNPWYCSCGLVWLSALMSESIHAKSVQNISIHDVSSTLCAHPDDKTGCLVSLQGHSGYIPSINNPNIVTDVPLRNAHCQPIYADQEAHNKSLDCAPRVLELFPPEISAFIGEELMVDCRALGLPEPSIVWMFKGSPISAAKMGSFRKGLNKSERVSVTKSGSLRIEYANHEDIGHFTCIASNIQGSDEVSFELTVKNVFSHVIVLRVTSDSITITWKNDPNAHNYQLLVRKLQSNATTYHKVDILSYMKYYTFSELASATKYELCIAVKHKQKSLLINCTSAITQHSGYSHEAVRDVSGFIIGGTSALFVVLFLLLCVGSQVARKYNRRRRFGEQMFGDQISEIFLDSYSETSPMTYENRFALMFDESDMEEIEASAAEASAALNNKQSHNI